MQISQSYAKNNHFPHRSEKNFHPENEQENIELFELSQILFTLISTKLYEFSFLQSADRLLNEQNSIFPFQIFNGESKHVERLDKINNESSFLPAASRKTLTFCLVVF